MSAKLHRLNAALQAAFSRLEDALAQPPDEYLRDACIQRFEFTFELLWKVLKAQGEVEGLVAHSPRESFRVAFRLALIPDSPVWFEMLEDRNLLSHTYDEETAASVYQRLPGYAEAIRNTVEALRVHDA